MRATTTTLLITLVAMAVAMADEPPAMPADLTGVWNLDQAVSDDLAGELQDLMQQLQAELGDQPSSRGKGSTTAPGGMSPTNRKPASSWSDEDGSYPPKEVDTSASRDLAQSMEQLLVTYDGTSIEIMDGTDQTRVWTPGALPVQREGPGGIVMEQSWWEQDTLVLSTNGSQLVTTRRLHLEDDGKTLVADVVVKVSRSSERIQARLVYRGY